MRRCPRSRLLFALVALTALAAVAGGPAAAFHDHHDDEPGLYNPECEILALAALGGTVALAERGPTIVVGADCGEPSHVVPVVRRQRSHRADGPRAPPHA